MCAKNVVGIDYWAIVADNFMCCAELLREENPGSNRATLR